MKKGDKRTGISDMKVGEVRIVPVQHLKNANKVVTYHRRKYGKEFNARRVFNPSGEVSGIKFERLS